MSLSSNFPTSKPSLNLDFANVGALDPRITFTRSSSATYTNSLGLIATAATNVARFDYDPVTLAARGLLVEESRSNLLTYSEQFDNAAWTTYLSRVSVTANAVTSPDGTTNADTITGDGTSGEHYIVQIITGVGSGKTLSFYAKAGTNNFIQVFTDYTSNEWANFDLATGTTGSKGSSTGATTITAVGNGWYRCTMVTGDALSQNINFLLISNSTAGRRQVNTLSTSVHLWGAQLEAGSFATSYIPTVASTVTRNTDLASINTLSPWYSSECTIYCEASVLPGNVNSSTKMLFGGGPTGNSPALIEYGGVIQLLVQSVGFPLYAATGLTVATKKVAGRFKNGNFGVAIDGVVTSNTTAISAGSGSAFGIGSVPIPSDYLNGYVRRVAFYPQALTNAELQALTS